MAYADFVTAMMALFLVLWLVSQDEDVKEAVERAFRNPSAHKAMVSKSSGLLTDQKEGHRHSRKERGRFNSSAATELKLLRRMHEDLMDVLTLFEVDHLPKKNIDSKANGDQKYKKHKTAH